jgi:lysophospholipase L1-like esterase
MRRRNRAAVLFLAAAVCLGAAKKKTVRPQVTVSSAMRAAALKRVAAYLDDSAGQGFAQPGALVPFFERLYLASLADGQPAVHIIQFGDSHTAADEWTGDLRRQFQQRFGDGGSGFSLAGRPFAGYRRFDIRGGATTLWHSEGLRSAVGDGYFGLGGVSVAAERAGQSVFVQTECDSLEVHFLQQPGGGGLALTDDDNHIDDISTDGELQAGFVRYDVSAGPHRFKLTTLNSRPVRLFGWVADRNAGVTYEALGINGAEASVLMKWNDAMLATYLQRRDPGLIVLSYGTNEASDPSWNPESYQAMFSTLLERLRVSAPAASILVIGPTDRWYRTRAGWKTLAGIDGIIAAQKQACRINRCAYWDARERMGGRGAMRDWVYAGLAQGDYVHFTAEGYRRLADTEYRDLIGQFEAYKKVRTEGEVPHGHAN